MPRFQIPTDPQTALRFACLFLAQNGNPAGDLGFNSDKSAFEGIAAVFAVKPRTVQNERDAFDHFTDSGRIGWVKETFPPRLKAVFDEYGESSREELEALAKDILKEKWGDIMPDDLLPDLQECLNVSRERAEEIPLDKPFVPSEEIWQEIVDAYVASGTSDAVMIVGGTTMVLTTPQQNFLSISGQEIPRCWAVLPYVRGILAY